MSRQDKPWVDKVPFANYRKMEKLFKDDCQKLNLTVTINGYKDSLSPEELSSVKLFAQKHGLEAMVGKEFNVVELNLNSNFIRIEPSNLLFGNVWEKEIRLDDHIVSLDEIRNEIRYKNMSELIDKLAFSKTKDGNFFEFGKKGLREYFAQDENHFFEFENSFVNEQFTLPDDAEERKRIVNFVNNVEPGSGDYLESAIPLKSSLVSRKRITPR